MESAGDNIILLFLGQLDEVYSVSADTDGQLRILFRMLLSVQQSFTIQYVYVQVVTAFFSIAVQQANQIFNLLFICHDKFLLAEFTDTGCRGLVKTHSSSINSVG